MNPMPSNLIKDCPCGHKDPLTHKVYFYTACCQKLHSQNKTAKNALELMRSRYSAYCLGLASYIIDTTDPTSPLHNDNRDEWLLEIEYFCKSNQFLGLKILSTQLKHEKRQTVEFEAKIIQFAKDPFSAAPAQSTSLMHENSLFLKKDGLWYYHSPLSLGFA